MGRVSVEEIQQDFSAYLQRVEAGETLTVTRGGQVVAEFSPARVQVKSARPFGLAYGEFEVPDDFDAPLPEDILRAFEGK